MDPNPDRLTFPEWHRRWPDWPGHGRLLAFQSLSEADQTPCWEDLSERCELKIESELLYEERRAEEWPFKSHQRGQQSTAATSTRSGAVVLSSSDDPLKRVPPSVYIEALTGEVPSTSGWLSCPFPDHEDRTPSFQVLTSHWRCFGCGRGGSAIDFGAAWYGIEPRGTGYHEIRRRLAGDLGLTTPA